MKQLTSIAICLLIAASSFAQAPKKGGKQVLPPITTLPQRNKAFHKNAIGGYFSDARKRPIKGVKTYVYSADSSIVASGFSDSTGYYETNSMKPGVYNLKVNYPGSKVTQMITGIPVLAMKITNISFMKEGGPEADTLIDYKDIAPKPIERSKGLKPNKK